MPKLNGVEYHGQGLTDIDKKNRSSTVNEHIKFHENNETHGTAPNVSGFEKIFTSIEKALIDDSEVLYRKPKSARTSNKSMPSGKLNNIPISGSDKSLYVMGYLSVLFNALWVEPIGMILMVLCFVLGKQRDNRKIIGLGILSMFAPLIGVLLYAVITFGIDNFDLWQLEYAIEHFLNR